MTKWDDLKSKLPGMLDSIRNKLQKTPNEWCSSCPHCGGDDRFLIWPKEDNGRGRFNCRGCGAKGDLIDLHCFLKGVDKTELLRMHSKGSMPRPMYRETCPALKTKTADRDCLSVEEIESLWINIQANYDRKKQSNDTISEYYFRKLRKIDNLDKIADISLAWYSLQSTDLMNEHQATKVPVVCYLYRNNQGWPCAIQFVCLNKHGLTHSRADKIFVEGSNAKEGFFFSGKQLEDAHTVVFVEAPINALSVTSLMPEICCIACFNANGSKLVKLKDRLNGKKIIVFFDFDVAGQRETKAAGIALRGKPIYSVKWSHDDPEGYDPNDLLKNGEDERIITMIENSALVPTASHDPLIHSEPDLSDLEDIPIKDSNTLSLSFKSLETVYCQKRVIRPIAENFFYDGDHMLIHGTGGTGKSLLVQDLAMHFAYPFGNNKNLWGKFNIPNPVATLFLQSENSQATTHIRTVKKCQGNEDLIKSTASIYYASQNDDVVVYGKYFSRTEQAFGNQIIEIARQIEETEQVKIRVLVIDPLISYISHDENDNMQMRQTLDFISEICRKIEATAIIIHHKNKNDQYRGASAIFDFCRTVVNLSSFDSGGKNCIQVKCEKMNNAPKFEPFSLQIDEHLNMIPLAGGDGIKPNTREQCANVVKSLSLLGAEMAAKPALVKQYMTLSGRSQRTAYRDIDEAAKLGYICECYDRSGDEAKPQYRMP